MLKVQNIETDRYAALVNEDRGHIVCWATSVKHKNIAQQWISLLLIFLFTIVVTKKISEVEVCYSYASIIPMLFFSFVQN